MDSKTLYKIKDSNKLSNILYKYHEICVNYYDKSYDKILENGHTF